MTWSNEKLERKRANSARLAGKTTSGKQKAAQMKERRAAEAAEIALSDQASASVMALDEHAAARYLFQGDGSYFGDGGAELQRLWAQLRWKPIKSCDGRFVSRERRLADLDQATLCHELAVKTCGRAFRCRDGDLPGEDAADAVRFQGGGGLLTYIKSSGDGTHVHVHTLNTESGFCRKLIALGAKSSAIDALPGDAGFWMGALCALLEAIPEPERTRVAPAAACAFRSFTARCGARPRAVHAKPTNPAGV